MVSLKWKKSNGLYLYNMLSRLYCVFMKEKKVFFVLLSPILKNGLAWEKLCLMDLPLAEWKGIILRTSYIGKMMTLFQLLLLALTIFVVWLIWRKYVESWVFIKCNCSLNFTKSVIFGVYIYTVLKD